MTESAPSTDRAVPAAASPARVLRVDLARVDPVPFGQPGSAPSSASARVEWVEARFVSAVAGRRRLAAAGGAALAYAWLMEHGRERPPLLFSVGRCVRRGVPTAARASVVGRAPLTGRLADGQVGGDLGVRLASVADLLVLEGALPQLQALARPRPTAPRTVAESGAFGSPAAVLVLRARRGEVPRAFVACVAGLAGCTPRETLARLRARFADAAAVCIGPAGEHGVPFASLVASGDSADEAHFVGRGGLGAVLGRCGLKALVIDAPAVEPARDAAARAAQQALLRSPRLAARARAGTLELFDALAARQSDPQQSQTARGVRDELEGARAHRHGCSGCPTPCGWSFDAPPTDTAGAAVRAPVQTLRFSAAWSLGLGLGLSHGRDALDLVARADALGVDAVELGRTLSVLCAARPELRGDARALSLRIDELERSLQAEAARGPSASEPFPASESLAGGAGELALRLGASPPPPNEPRAREGDVAARLGAAVSSRGADPMRTFPFLMHDATPARAARVLAPLRLDERALSPSGSDGVGRVVAWHESLSAALDVTGFCAFSAAALLADGVIELDELARWIAPDEGCERDGARGAGARLLDLGQRALFATRRIEESWGVPRDPARAPDGDAAARALFAAPGAWAEYARARGLDPDGRTSAAARAAFDAGADLPWPSDLCHDAVEGGEGGGGSAADDPHDQEAQRRLADAAAGRRPGRVHLRSGALLADHFGAECELELDLPARAEEVLAVLAARFPAARALLFPGGRPLPVLHRDGQRLDGARMVHAGERLDLVLVISGGAR